MDTFILVIFWIELTSVFARIINLVTGAYSKPSSIGAYAADTVITATFAIWAAFILWYR